MERKYYAEQAERYNLESRQNIQKEAEDVKLEYRLLLEGCKNMVEDSRYPHSHTPSPLRSLFE